MIKTVYVLIDQPNLDYLLLPVIEEMLARGDFAVIACICNWGKEELLREKGIPLVTDPKSFADFYHTSGHKLFLTASDCNVTPHFLGQKFAELSRQEGIPSLSVEHAAHSVYENWPQTLLFNSDRIALAGEIEFEKYKKLGVSEERLVITGCPKYDPYCRLNGAGAFQQTENHLRSGLADKTILFAGVNHGYLKKYTREQWTGVLQNIYKGLGRKYQKHTILVKPHPSDPDYQAADLYEAAITPDLRSRIRIIESHGFLSHLILAADVVVSFTPSVMLESLLLRKPVIHFGHLAGEGSATAACQQAGATFIRPDWLRIAAVINESLPDEAHNGFRKIQLSDDFIAKFAHKWDGRAAHRIVELIAQMIAKKPIHLHNGIMPEENFE